MSRASEENARSFAASAVGLSLRVGNVAVASAEQAPAVMVIKMPMLVLKHMAWNTFLLEATDVLFAMVIPPAFYFLSGPFHMTMDFKLFGYPFNEYPLNGSHRLSIGCYIHLFLDI